MKKTVVTLIALAVAVALGWRIYQKSSARRAVPTPRKQAGAVAVEISPVRKAEIRDLRPFAGTLLPKSQFVVAPKISGRLEKLLVDVGDKVSPGQLLAVLDGEEYARQVEQAAAEVEVAKAGADEVRLNAELEDRVSAQQVAQSQAELDFAKANAEEIRLNALLDEQDSAQAVAQAKSEIDIAQARLAETRSRLAAAKREFDRAKSLRETKILSDSEFDQAEDEHVALNAQIEVVSGEVSQKEAALKAAQLRLSEFQQQSRSAKHKLALAQIAQKEAALRAAEVSVSETQDQARSAQHKFALAQVAQKEAALKAAEVRLAYAQIQASWADGTEPRIVGERFVDQGAMLMANAPLVSILDIQSVIAVIHVIERDYSQIQIGQAVVVSTDAFPGKTFSGKVVRVAPLLREESRQARTEIEIPNPNGLLKPGMFVRAEIELARHADATVVPANAVVKRNGRQGVFLVNRENRKADFVPITVGIVSNGQAEAIQPPLSGDVVTLGHHLLEDGSSISLPENVESGSEQPRDAAGQAEEKQ